LFALRRFESAKEYMKERNYIILPAYFYWLPLINLQWDGLDHSPLSSLISVEKRKRLSITSTKLIILSYTSQPCMHYINLIWYILTYDSERNVTFNAPRFYEIIFPVWNQFIKIYFQYVRYVVTAGSLAYSSVVRSRRAWALSAARPRFRNTIRGFRWYSRSLFLTSENLIEF